MTTGEKLAEILFEEFAHGNAHDNTITKLAEILHTFRTSHYRVYNSVKRQPFAAHLIEALEEAVSFREQLKEVYEMDLAEEKARQEAHNKAMAEITLMLEMQGG